MTALTEKTFDNWRDRELRRFHKAVDKVVEGLLLEKYESTRQAGEFRRYAKTCGFVKDSLRALDMLTEHSGALFDRANDRSNWEVYLSGLRRLFRQMPDSYLFRFVLPMFGLDDLGEKVSAYSQKWLDQTHAAQKVLRETERYLGNLDRGASVAADYRADDLEMVRLYASLKTWQSKEEFEAFVDDVDEFLASSVEVFVSGPVQLYLMLSRDTMLLIFKSLSVGKLTDLRDGESDYAELMRFSDFVRSLVQDSETLRLSREIVVRATKEYVSDLRRDQERLRAQLPDRATKRSFVQRFETGALFRREDETD